MQTEKLTSLKGRTWVTRAPNIHVDRMASAWLIRRWVSRGPFSNGSPTATIDDSEIHFDMYQAEFTHEEINARLRFW